MECFHIADKFDLLPHFNSTTPNSNKTNIIYSEIKRRHEHLSTNYIQKFKQTLISNDSENICNYTMTTDIFCLNTQKNGRFVCKKLFFKFSCINDKIDGEVRKNIRDLNLIYAFNLFSFIENLSLYVTT